MQCVSLKAYAKINLGLAILGRRADGYHELRTIYQSISLADRLEIRLDSGARRVRLESRGFPVPTGTRNLAVRAAEMALSELGLRRQVAISLDKRIPPGSGLGGASSDAAAVLRALLCLSRKKLLVERLLRLSADLGSDVPFFLLGGRALGLGRGEEVYPLPEAPPQAVVVVFPGGGMNTADAYRSLRAPRLTVSHARPTIELFCGRALRDGAPVSNDFEQMVLRRFPGLVSAKQLLLRSGATAASVSGSGAALYGLYSDRAKARTAAGALRESGWRVYLSRTVSRREFQAQLPSAQRSR